MFEYPKQTPLLVVLLTKGMHHLEWREFHLSPCSAGGFLPSRVLVGTRWWRLFVWTDMQRIAIRGLIGGAPINWPTTRFQLNKHLCWQKHQSLAQASPINREKKQPEKVAPGDAWTNMNRPQLFVQIFFWKDAIQGVTTPSSSKGVHTQTSRVHQAPMHLMLSVVGKMKNQHVMLQWPCALRVTMPIGDISPRCLLWGVVGNGLFLKVSWFRLWLDANWNWFRFGGNVTKY